MDKQRVVIVATCVAGMLGTFLPWISATFVSVDGTRGDGWLSLFAFLGALVIAATGHRSMPLTAGPRFGVFLLTAGALAVALYDTSKLADAPDGIVIGSGLILVIAASTTVLITACVGGNPVQAVATMVSLFLVAVFGFLHVTYGSERGIKVCRKTRWSLQSTFVDLKEPASIPRHAVAALAACGAVTITKEPSPPIVRDDVAPSSSEGPNAGVSCRVPNAVELQGRTARGTCRDLSDCNDGFVYYTGFCRGPANIVCCVRAP